VLETIEPQIEKFHTQKLAIPSMKQRYPRTLKQSKIIKKNFSQNSTKHANSKKHIPKPSEKSDFSKATKKLKYKVSGLSGATKVSRNIILSKNAPQNTFTDMIKQNQLSYNKNKK
jgi:hypothetical protein